MNNELKPCPFCGSAANYFQDEGRYTGRPVWSVGCDDEECFGFVSITGFSRKADARVSWNKRAPCDSIRGSSLADELQDANERRNKK